MGFLRVSVLYSAVGLQRDGCYVPSYLWLIVVPPGRPGEDTAKISIILERERSFIMSTTVSDFLLERLSSWGVKRIFGYPGDGINGLLGGLQRHQDLFEFVQVRHEEMAAFMATAHAKFTD